MLGQRSGWSMIDYGARETDLGLLYTRVLPSLWVLEGSCGKMRRSATMVKHWAADLSQGRAREKLEPHIFVRVTENSLRMSHVKSVKLKYPKDASIVALECIAWAAEKLFVRIVRSLAHCHRRNL